MALSTEISATKENIWVFLDSHNHRWWAKIGCIVPTSLLWLCSWVIVKMMRVVECWRNEVISLGEAETSGRMRECKKLYKLSKIFQNLCPRIQYTQCKSKQSSIPPPNKTIENWTNAKCTVVQNWKGEAPSWMILCTSIFWNQRSTAQHLYW